MDELDDLLDGKSSKNTTTPDDLFQIPSGDVRIAEKVVMDEKCFHQGYLFAALHKGMAVLDLKHGMGIGITGWVDDKGNRWIKLQVLHAGCGSRVARQSVPISAKKARQNRTVKLDNKGKQGNVDAWDVGK